MDFSPQIDYNKGREISTMHVYWEEEKMLKNIVLFIALICSCVYMALFWVNSPKLNVIANKIQKPFVAVSVILLIIYIIL